MKKRFLFLAVALLALFAFASHSAVSAEPNQPIECVIDIVFDAYPDGLHWEGPMYGCELAGDVRFDPDPANPNFAVGNTNHFFELFTITLDNGGFIKGHNAGIWETANFKFTANGWVTETSPGLEYMIGYKYFEKGTTTDFTTGLLPQSALGTTMKLIPAHGPNNP